MPPSDAYFRSFLYLLHTLIKLYYTKALSDPASSLARIELGSSGGQESHVLSFSNNLSRTWSVMLRRDNTFFKISHKTCLWCHHPHHMFQWRLWSLPYYGNWCHSEIVKENAPNTLFTIFLICLAQHAFELLQNTDSVRECLSLHNVVC